MSAEPDLIALLRQDAEGDDYGLTYSAARLRQLVAHIDALVAERDAAVRERDEARRLHMVVRNELDTLRARLAMWERLVADENAVVEFLNRERRDRGVRTMSAEKEMLVRRAVRLAYNGATNMTRAVATEVTP